MRKFGRALGFAGFVFIVIVIGRYVKVSSARPSASNGKPRSRSARIVKCRRANSVSCSNNNCAK